MIAFFLYKLGGALTRVFPVGFSYWIAIVFADLNFLVNRHSRRAVIANLTRVCGSEVRGPELDRMARRVFHTFALNIVDFLRLPVLDLDSLRQLVHIEGWDHIDHALAEGRGFILLSAHIGNWELAGALFGLNGIRLRAVALDHGAGRVTRFFAKRRREKGVDVLPLTGSTYAMLECLRSGGAVALIADRDFAQQGKPVPFFGELATMPRAHASLALKTGAPLLPCFLVREADRHFRMMIGPPVSTEGLPHGDRVRGLVERSLRVFEGVIRRYPDQWCVFVPMWGATRAADVSTRGISLGRERVSTGGRVFAPGRVFAVIPAYNPGQALAQVAAGAAAELGGASVVVVDDGSSDGAAERARATGVGVVRHPANRGKGAALRTGFAAALAAGADWVFTLDADGQHDPREMPAFLAEAARGRYDLLIGDRMADPRGMPGLRVFANRSTSSIISLLAGQRITDSQSGYRLIAAPLLRAVDLHLDRFDAESEILVKAARAGFRIGAVPVRSIYGEERSTIHPVRDTIRFMKMVLRLAPISLRRPLGPRQPTPPVEEGS